MKSLCKIIISISLTLFSWDSLTAGQEFTTVDNASFLRQLRLSVPVSETEFAADGQIRPDEEKSSSVTRQGLRFNDNAFADTRCEFRFGCNGRQLYVSFKIPVPEGAELVANALKDDSSALWKTDNSAEIRIIGKDRIFNFIGNGAGIRGAKLYQPKKPFEKPELWKYGASVSNGIWQSEFVIDAAALDMDHIRAGQTVQLDAAVHLREMGDLVSLGSHSGKWHSKPSGWPLLTFASMTAPYQSGIELGNVNNGSVGLVSTFRNAGASEAKIRFRGRVWRNRDTKNNVSALSEIEGVLNDSGIDILPGASNDQKIIWAMDKNIIPNYECLKETDETVAIGPHAGREFKMSSPSVGGNYFIAYRFDDPDSGLTFAAGACPFMQFAPLQTTFEYRILTAGELLAETRMPANGNIRKLRYRIFGKSDDSKPAIEKTETLGLKDGMIVSQRFSVRELTPGDYRFIVEGQDEKGALIASYSEALPIPSLPFWHNGDAGNVMKVPRPWKPITADDTQITVSERIYHFGKNGLPDSIESLKRELLAGPCRLTISTDKGSLDEDKIVFRRQITTPEKAVFNISGSMDGLDVSGSLTAMFEGSLRWDLTLAPADGASTEIKVMTLSVPVAKNVAEFFIRAKSMTTTPDSMPAAWSETFPLCGSVGEKIIRFPFTPTLALFSDRVGIQWLAEQDWDWCNRAEDRKIEIIPSGKSVEMKIYLIDRPVKIAEALHFTFGLIAWPVKPWPEEPETLTHYLGNPADKKEKQGQLNTVELMKMAKQEGADSVLWFHLGAEPGRQPNYPELYEEDNKKAVRELTGFASTAGLPIFGHMAYAMPAYTSDSPFYLMEMARRPIERKGAYGLKACPKSPYADAFVGRYKKFCEEYGVSGAHIDGGLMLFFCEAGHHGCGKSDATGKLRGSYPVFALRDMARRLYTVFNDEVKFKNIDHGLLNNHRESDSCSPALAFSHFTESGEGFGIESRHLSELDETFLKAIYPGMAMGVQVNFMVKEGVAHMGNRGRLALALLMGWTTKAYRILDHLNENNYELKSLPYHKIYQARRWSGYQADDFIPYWKSVKYASSDSPDAKCSMFLNRNKGRCLLTAVNWSGKRQFMKFTLSAQAMDLAGKLTATDAITGETVAVSGQGEISLDIEGDGYRLIKIQVDIPESTKTGEQQ